MYLRDKSSGLCNGTECRAHMQRYAVITDDTPVPQVSLHLSLKHTYGTCTDSCARATTHQLTRAMYASTLKKEGRASVGEGAQQRYHIPCAHDGSHVWSRTKKGWSVGQRERRIGDAGVGLRKDELGRCCR